MANTGQELSTKVITGMVRFCYCHVFEPASIGENGTPKYNVSIVIDKNDTKTLNAINQAVENAKKIGMDKIGKNGKISPNIKLPLRDGDAERPDETAYENAFFVNANSLQKPQVIDRDRNILVTSDDFYSGCYGRASLNFYAYNADGNKGIACGLNNLQKLKEGERLSGGSSAEEDFADDFEDDDMS